MTVLLSSIHYQFSIVTLLSIWKTVRRLSTLLRNVHIQQMEDNQTTIELPPEADTESTNLPDDDAENPVGGIRYPTIQIIQTFTYSAEEGELLQVNSVG